MIDEILTLPELINIYRQDTKILKETKCGLFISFKRIYEADYFQKCIESLKCDFRRHGNKFIIWN